MALAALMLEYWKFPKFTKVGSRVKSAAHSPAVRPDGFTAPASTSPTA